MVWEMIALSDEKTRADIICYLRGDDGGFLARLDEFSSQMSWSWTVWGLKSEPMPLYWWWWSWGNNSAISQHQLNTKVAQPMPTISTVWMKMWIDENYEALQSHATSSFPCDSRRYRCSASITRLELMKRSNQVSLWTTSFYYLQGMAIKQSQGDSDGL